MRKPRRGPIGVIRFDGDAAGRAGRPGLARVVPWRAIGIFLAFTICLDAPFWVIVNATATVNTAYIFGMMWMPAIAAFLTCRVLGRPVRSLGLGTWNGRFVLLGYLIPIAYCLVASLGTWLFGFRRLPERRVRRQTAESFGVGGAPDWVVIAMFVALTGTTGILCRSWRRSCRSRAWRWSRA